MAPPAETDLEEAWPGKNAGLATRRSAY